jgi:ElaB/YqjD/DUF883 family membrane-anchored ribosome-binding protein
LDELDELLQDASPRAKEVAREIRDSCKKMEARLQKYHRAVEGLGFKRDK